MRPDSGVYALLPPGLLPDISTPLFPLALALTSQCSATQRRVLAGSEMEVQSLRGSRLWVRLSGVDRVAHALASRRSAGQPEEEDYRQALWICATDPLRAWLRSRSRNWPGTRELDVPIVSALRAHAYGLPLWETPPAWWTTLEPGIGGAALLSARKAALRLAAPEMLLLGFGLHKAASPFVHLDRLALGFEEAGVEGWLRRALHTLPWLPKYEQFLVYIAEEVGEPPRVSLVDSLAKASAERWLRIESAASS